MTRKLSNKGTHKIPTATQDEVVGLYEAFPVLFVYSIWEARNITILKNVWVSPDLTIALLMNKIQDHKLILVPVKRRLITTPNINKDIPWEFFDGESKGMPPFGGAGEVIYISVEKKLRIKYTIGKATNNK